MKRVLVIGSPGAGKSTFARKLRDGTGLPLYYLDMVWHRSDRTNISREEFDQRLCEILEKDRWIVDGNYLRTLEMRLNACDTVFFLDTRWKSACREWNPGLEDRERICRGWKQSLIRSFASGFWIFPGSSGRRSAGCWKNTGREEASISFMSGRMRTVS